MCQLWRPHGDASARSRSSGSFPSAGSLGGSQASGTPSQRESEGVASGLPVSGRRESSARIRGLHVSPGPGLLAGQCHCSPLSWIRPSRCCGRLGFHCQASSLLAPSQPQDTKKASEMEAIQPLAGSPCKEQGAAGPLHASQGWLWVLTELPALRNPKFFSTAAVLPDQDSRGRWLPCSTAWATGPHIWKWALPLLRNTRPGSVCVRCVGTERARTHQEFHFLMS